MFEYKASKKEEARARVEEYMDSMPQFITSYVMSVERIISPLSLRLYLQRIDVFFHYLQENNENFKGKDIKEFTVADLGNLKRLDIENFIHHLFYHGAAKKEKNTRTTTTNNYICALNSLYRFLFEEEYINANPLAKVRRSPAKRDKEIIRLKRNETRKLLSTVENGTGLSKRQNASREKTELRDLCILVILLKTGIRVSELVGLDLDDVNLQECSLRILRKREKADKIFFDDEVAGYIREYLETRKEDYQPTDDEQALFLVSIGTYKGCRLSVRSVENLVKKYADAGVPEKLGIISPHKLRATFATALSKKEDLASVQDALGHADPKTTRMYVDSTSREKKRNDTLNIY